MPDYKWYQDIKLEIPALTDIDSNGYKLAVYVVTPYAGDSRVIGIENLTQPGAPGLGRNLRLANTEGTTDGSGYVIRSGITIN